MAEVEGGKYRSIVRLYVDKDGGVTLDDCASVSRQVGDLLDVHDTIPGSYTLEVSSPGLNRPLVRDKDFEKFRGEMVKISLSKGIEGRKQFSGRLVGSMERGGRTVVVIEADGCEYELPRADIAKANIQYQF